MVLAIVSLASAGADVIFSENFDDSPPYSDGGSIPTGLNTINLGQWTTNANNATATTNTSLSATRSMELNGVVNVAGYFGTNNSGMITTTNPLSIRFAFNLTSTAAADVYLRTHDHSTVALLQLSGASQYVRIQNSGGWNTSISVDRDTWYYAELSMPGDPGGSGTSYSMKVYESDGTTQHGDTTSGSFTTTLTNQKSYRYVTFANNSSGSILYFDNISVNTIPEPAALTLLLGSGILLVAARRRRAS